jgi:hypothetical protein
MQYMLYNYFVIVNGAAIENRPLPSAATGVESFYRMLTHGDSVRSFYDLLQFTHREFRRKTVSFLRVAVWYDSLA